MQGKHANKWLRRKAENLLNKEVKDEWLDDKDDEHSHSLRQVFESHARHWNSSPDTYDSQPLSPSTCATSALAVDPGTGTPLQTVELGGKGGPPPVKGPPPPPPPCGAILHPLPTCFFPLVVWPKQSLSFSHHTCSGFSKQHLNMKSNAESLDFIVSRPCLTCRGQTQQVL